TERKRAEEALRQSEQTYHFLVESIPNTSIHLIDQDLRFLITGGVELAKNNLEKSQVEGRTLREAFPEDVADLFEPLYRKAFKGEATEFEMPYGPYHYFQQIVPVGDADGQIFAVMIISTNITERKRTEDALRASKNRLTLAQKAGKIGIWDWGLEQDRLIWDERMYEMYGVKPESFSGNYEGWKKNLHPDDLAEAVGAVQQAIHNQHEFHFEFRIVPPSGEVRYIEAHALVIYNANDQPTQMVGVNIDVTERRQAEEALRESKKLLQDITDLTPALIYMLDTDGRFMLFNRKLEELFSVKSSEVIGQTRLNIMPPEIAQQHRNNDLRVINTRRSQNFEEENLEADGTHHYLTTKFPLFNTENEIYAICGISIDITDRKRAEKALSESAENLRIILNSIGDAVIATDTQARIVRLNPVAERLSGWSQAEAIGNPFQQVFPLIQAQNRRPVADPVERILQTGQIVEPSKDVILIAKYGREYGVATSGTPLQNLQGETMGMVLVLRDITQQLQNEQELLKASKLESVGVLAGGIAHDFNNLLTALFGNIEMAKLTLPPSHDAYDYLEATSNAMERAIGLTKQLLTFAKGGAPIKKIQDIGQLLVDTATFGMHGSKSKVEITIAPDLWPVDVDEGQLSQVINNLIINSQQAMPNGGIINLSAVNDESTGQPYVKITVKDEGIGIAPENLDKIFDPYFSTKPDNSGLGLATVHSIITKHNGQITVDSRLDHGAIITILLPANPKAASPPAFNRTIGVPADQGVSARILVLDDEEAVGELLEAILTRTGYQVTLTTEGQATIAAYQEAMQQGHPYQAVILDLTIPGGIGGQDVARQILAIDHQAKLIASSGYATDPVMADYETYGFKARVAKPYRLATLQQTLQTVLA
ncbi:MAG: PAS domain-containing protein, partial [Anaerolineae bacterium]|nr:PAS domain-containing protein [Anaerolineae bacterium]